MQIGQLGGSADKRLDRMDRLADLAYFPAAVNAGATANILVTITITRWLVPRFAEVYAPAVWIALVLFLNLLPVVVLRAIRFNKGPVPTLRQMNFLRDQHRFSDWVYLAASANMAFWILLAWSAFSISPLPTTLAAVLIVGFLATFSPVLLRILASSGH